MRFTEKIKWIARDIRALAAGDHPGQYTMSKYRDFENHIDHAYKQLSQRYFPAAETGRLRNDWASSISSTYDILNTEYKKLVARAKLQYDTDPYARSASNVVESQIVGKGIRPKPKPIDENGNTIPGIADQLNRDWERFNDECLRNRSETFYSLQTRNMRSMLVSGGMFLNKIPSKQGSMLPFAYQVIDQSQLDFTRDYNGYKGSGSDNVDIGTDATEKQVVHGISIDRYGDPLFYHFEPEWQAIPAANIIHSFVKSHVNQYIGVPGFAPALTTLWDLNQLAEDKIIASRIIACIAFWIQKKDNAQFRKSVDTSDNVSFAPGKVMALENEPKIIQAQDTIGETFAPMVVLYLRSVAVSLGISYQELTGDMEGANFSSARVNVIDARRRYAQRQKNVIHTLCKPVYRDFVKWEFLTGRIPGKTITDYTQNEWGLTQALWTPDPYEWVDPLKDIQALKEEAAQGWLTDEQYFEAKGRDRDSVYAILAEEKKAKKSLDILPEPKQPAAGKPVNAEENNAE